MILIENYEFTIARSQLLLDIISECWIQENIHYVTWLRQHSMIIIQLC